MMEWFAEQYNSVTDTTKTDDELRVAKLESYGPSLAKR